MRRNQSPVSGESTEELVPVPLSQDVLFMQLKGGGVGDSFGEYLCIDGANLDCVNGRNQVTTRGKCRNRPVTTWVFPCPLQREYYNPCRQIHLLCVHHND